MYESDGLIVFRLVSCVHLRNVHLFIHLFRDFTMYSLNLLPLAYFVSAN